MIALMTLQVVFCDDKKEKYHIFPAAVLMAALI